MMRAIWGAVFLLVLACDAFADSGKIAVVDLQKIMQSSSQLKEIQQNFEKQFKPQRDKLLAQEESLKSDAEKLKRDAAIMSETQKKALEKKIMDAQQQYQRDAQQFQQQAGAANNEAMEGLYNKVREAISKVALADKYDLVIQKDAAPYSVASLDVTDKVIQGLAK